MALSRIGTFALQQATLANASRVQANIYDAQVQISSGLKTQNFSGFANEVEFFSDLENRIEKSTRFTQNNRQVQARVSASETAISQIIDIANDFKNQILQKRSGVADSLDFEQQAFSTFQAIAGQLNTQLDGRYLFSGSRTNVAAVRSDRLPIPVEFGQADASYYQGDAADITARIQEEYELAYNIRANDEGFQKIISAISMAVEGGVQGDDQILTDAYDMLEQGIKGAIQSRSQAGTHYNTIESVNTRLDSQKIYWNNLKSQTIDSDPVVLSTRLAVDQAVLQASFQAFARINSLQLSDFLG